MSHILSSFWFGRGRALLLGWLQNKAERGKWLQLGLSWVGEVPLLPREVAEEMSGGSGNFAKKLVLVIDKATGVCKDGVDLALNGLLGPLAIWLWGRL